MFNFRPDGTIKFLTKGDNINYDDRELYVGQLWLTKSNVVGYVKGVVPYFRMITMLMKEYPKIKVNTI